MVCTCCGHAADVRRLCCVLAASTTILDYDDYYAGLDNTDFKAAIAGAVSGAYHVRAMAEQYGVPVRSVVCSISTV